MATDLPLPVLPATSKCGMRSMPATIGEPETSLPSGRRNLPLERTNSSLSRMSRSATVEIDELGISIPTTDFPGMGASMRIDGAANASAKSLSRVVILLTLTPTAGWSSYWVTAGPTLMLTTRASTLKLASVSSIRRDLVRCSSSLMVASTE